MKILLDLDGVLVNFVNGAAKYHNINLDPYPFPGTWDFVIEVGFKPAKFWDLPRDFWANLDWMPDGKEILDICYDRVGVDNVCLLTCPTLSGDSAAGKMDWINQNIPELRRQYLMGPAKHFVGNSTSLLIDDADHNIVDYPYTSVLVPRPWNSGYDEKYQGAEYLRRTLL